MNLLISTCVLSPSSFHAMNSMHDMLSNTMLTHLLVEIDEAGAGCWKLERFSTKMAKPEQLTNTW